ncbi:MAG: hypothetical protein ABIO02_01390 [Patescibacteria group bacterium]
MIEQLPTNDISEAHVAVDISTTQTELGASERKAPAYGINYSRQELLQLISGFKRSLKAATNEEDEELKNYKTELSQELGPIVLKDLYFIVYDESSESDSEKRRLNKKEATNRVQDIVDEHTLAISYWNDFQNSDTKYSKMVKTILLAGNSRTGINLIKNQDDPDRNIPAVAAYRTAARQSFFAVGPVIESEDAGKLSFIVWPYDEENPEIAEAASRETAVSGGINLTRSQMKEYIQQFKSARRCPNKDLSYLAEFEPNMVITRELGEMAFWNLDLIAKLEREQEAHPYTRRHETLREFAQKKFDLIVDDYFCAANYWNSEDREPGDYSDMMKDIVESAAEQQMGIDTDDGFHVEIQHYWAALKTVARQMGYRLGPQRYNPAGYLAVKINNPQMDMVERAFVTEIDNNPKPKF